MSGDPLRAPVKRQIFCEAQKCKINHFREGEGGLAACVIGKKFYVFSNPSLKGFEHMKN